MDRDPVPTAQADAMERLALIGLWIVAGALCVVVVLMFRTSAMPALGDYGEWTYHGVLLRDALQGHPDAAYWLKNYPVPNSLTTVGLGLLMVLLPWKIAAKVWLVMELALGLWATLKLQRSAGPAQPWRVLVVGAAVLLGTPFWFGFMNFLFGLYLTMILCALLLAGVESRWIYGALLILIFFSHMIPFGFAALAIGLYALQERRGRLLWQMVPSFALCLWYFAGRLLHGDADAKAGMLATVPYLSPLFALFKANSYLKCWGFINPACNGSDSVLLRIMGTKIFVVLFAANAVIAVGVLAMLAMTARRAIGQRTKQRFFWIAVVVFFAVALGMPGAAAGISDPGGRMMEVAIWCGVCAVSVRRRLFGVALALLAASLLVADCTLFGAAAMQPPMPGSTAGPLPAHMREFAHAYYGDRYGDYAVMDEGVRSIDIYPTAMFLKKSR